MTFGFVIRTMLKLIPCAQVTLQRFYSFEVWLVLDLLQDDLYRCVEQGELLKVFVLHLSLLAGATFILTFGRN